MLPLEDLNQLGHSLRMIPALLLALSPEVSDLVTEVRSIERLIRELV